MKKLMIVIFLSGMALLYNDGFAQKERKIYGNNPDHVGCKVDMQNSISTRFNKAAFTYNVDSIILETGTEASEVLTVTDAATIGPVTIHYDYTVDFYASEGSFTLTSPAGTIATIGEDQLTETYSVTLVDFIGEELTGDWTFTLHDTFGDGGEEVRNIVFEVDLAPTTPIATLNYNTWDAGQVQVGFSSATDDFILMNTGIDTVVVSAVTDLTGSDFSTDFVMSDVSLTTGDAYAFGFEYIPTDFGVDSVSFEITTNAGTLTVSLSGEGMPPADANFEDGVIPDGWIVVNNDGDSKKWEAYKTTSGYLAHSGEWVAKVGYNISGNDDWLILPKLAPAADNSELSFWATSTSTSYNEDFKVMLSTTGTALSDFTVELGAQYQIPNEWNNYSYDLSSYIGSEVYVAVVCISVDELNLYVDDFFAPILYLDNDLAATEIAGNSAPTQGSIASYSVTVKNVGALSQTDYTVKLMGEGDVEFGSVAGDTLDPKASATYDFNYTFTSEGPTFVYGKVVLASDENADNDATGNLNIDVQPLGTVTVAVGDGDLTSNKLPVDFFYKSSLTEAIYYPGEINMGGALTAIDYFNNFITNLPAMPIRIWAGETDADDLTGGWIPATDLSLVFDGNVDFPSGENTIHIALDSQFMFTGGKLVLMVERPLDSVYYSLSDVFYNTETPDYPGRSVSYFSDSNPMDPDAPTGGTLYDQVPNTTLYFDVSGMGSLEGVVYDELSNPMMDAEVSIAGTAAKTFTNDTGYYAFPYLFEGDYQVNVNKFGYLEATDSTTIVEFQTSVVDFNMVLRPQVAVTGSVEKSDFPGVGLQNAVVNIEGYENYTDTTDANGDFAIADVWGYNTYMITISAEGCVPYEGEFTLMDTAFDFGTIVLAEIPYPAIGVAAEMNDSDEGVVTWMAPGSGVEVQYVIDDGTAENGWLINPGYESWLGNKFEVADAGSLVSFDIYGQINESAGTEDVSIDVFDADFNLIGTSEPFAIPSDEWITVAMEGVEFSGEFYAMIHWNNLAGATHYVGFDEDGENANSNFDWYTDGTDWMTIHEAAASNPGVFLMRANAFVTGSATKLSASTAVMHSTANNSSALSSSGKHSDTHSYAETTYKPVNNQDKAFESYDIFRLLDGEEDTTELWTSLSTAIVDTNYLDAGLATVADGVYKYAVIANYTNGVVSNPAFSNALPVGMEALVTVNVTTNSSDNTEGAMVTLENLDGDEMHYYEGTAGSDGAAIFDLVWKGTYVLNVSLAGFDSYTDTALVITNDTETIDVELIEQINSPGGLSVEFTGTSTILSWGGGGPGEEMFADDFENGFFAEGWEIIEGDGTIGEAGFPYWYVSDALYYEGLYSAIVDWGYDIDTWLITPSVSCTNTTVVSFAWNASYYWSVDPYDNQDLFIEVSTDGGTTWESIWTYGDIGVWENFTWYETSLDLSAYAGSNVMIGFHLVGNDNAQNGLDNVFVGNSTKTDFGTHRLTGNVIADADAKVAPENSGNKSLVQYLVYLDDMTTPIGYTSEMSYEFTDLIEGNTYTAGVVAEYTTGTSEMSTLDFTVPDLSTVTFNVTTNAGSAEGAYLEMYNDNVSYSAEVPADGTVIFEGVENDTYDIFVSLVDFKDYEDVITLSDDMTIDVQLEEIIDAPFNLEINVEENSAVFTWNNVYGNEEFMDDFEAGDFVDEWELIEGDGTVGETGLPYWYVSDALYYEGAFGAVTDWGYDIDTWLITPGVTVDAGYAVTFAWNSSYYWSVDPNDNCDLFIEISTDGGNSWESIWTYGEIGVWENFTWYETTVSLDDYAGQTVEVAFHLVGNDNSQNAIDMVYIGADKKSIGTRKLTEATWTAINAKSAPISSVLNKSFNNYNVYLDDMSDPWATTNDESYTFTGLNYETFYTAGVSSQYTSGESDIVTIDFETPVSVADLSFNNHFTLYPNPASNKLNIASDLSIDKVEVYNAIGNLVIVDDNVFDGIDVSEFAEGIYFVKIHSDGNVAIKRISVTK